MHIAFRWDGLKYQLSKLDYHPTEEWDRHFAWENFKSGRLLVSDGGVWVYVNFEVMDKYDFTVFEGELIHLDEVDPIFD